MKTYKMDLAGRPFVVEIGEVAQLAKGSAMVRYGETSVLAVAGASKKPREGLDFFPLSVDYEEKQYAVGKIPGGFLKREGRPSEKAILNARLIDRPIRPLFPDGFRNDVQIVTTVLSVEQDNAPNITAMIGASIALSISDIPFDGPVGSVCVGLINNQLVLNPTESQREESKLDLVVSGTEEAIMMVEAGADEVDEATMLKAILFAHEEIKKIVAFQNEIIADLNVVKKDYTFYLPSEEMVSEITADIAEKMQRAVHTVDKLERQENINALKDETLEKYLEKYPENESEILEVIEDLQRTEIRSLILDDHIRPDNRKMDEVRPIESKVDYIPRVHGAGLFSRGETQVLSVATLGVLRDAQILDGLSNETEKRYMHQYNFPSYSVGETRPMRGPGRREIGHGALAERALLPMIPSEESFPYAIRVVSEVLSSNGSTSQASVCGSTLALMAAGVPIKKPVAGVAMGLMKEGDKLAILTDIQGVEDFMGDMDFKVAGTADGITAIQMDIKVHGIDKDVLTKALEQARIGRLHILNKMLEVIPEPREELSPYAPRILTMQINPEKIRDVIGSGGKVINKIIEQTGVTIDIEDSGMVYIASADSKAAKEAQDIIENIVHEVEVGEIYTGKVVSILKFGAFVSLPGGKDGLIHISKLANERVRQVEDVVKLGDEVKVKVIEIDDQGRINLSRKALLGKKPHGNKA
ncbi:MAG: polyribonucleotide nucleotidyltransferase [Eubacteriaceae bacterium]|nr:polyribonucleotide nucleotidyltransferase [Eubacteriaceae bacterium]